MLLSILLLLLEMVAYGKWLFNVTSSLSRANPTYQLAVVGNFLLSVMGTRVSGNVTSVDPFVGKPWSPRTCEKWSLRCSLSASLP